MPFGNVGGMFVVVSVKLVLVRNWVPFMVMLSRLSYVGLFMTMRSQMFRIGTTAVCVMNRVAGVEVTMGNPVSTVVPTGQILIVSVVIAVAQEFAETIGTTNVMKIRAMTGIAFLTSLTKRELSLSPYKLV